jgi:hypothetical protein
MMVLNFKPIIFSSISSIFLIFLPLAYVLVVKSNFLIAFTYELKQTDQGNMKNHFEKFVRRFKQKADKDYRVQRVITRNKTIFFEQNKQYSSNKTNNMFLF